MVCFILSVTGKKTIRHKRLCSVSSHTLTFAPHIYLAVYATLVYQSLRQIPVWYALSVWLCISLMLCLNRVFSQCTILLLFIFKGIRKRLLGVLIIPGVCA